MNLRLIVIAFLAALLSGCPSHEGTYSPGCIAFEGSNITLGDGRFVWEKFTDMRVVDDDGIVVNPFPGFPMRGSYRIEDQSVSLESDAGGPVQTMYLHSHDDSYYLLTADEVAVWEQTGRYGSCTLRLVTKTEK